MTNGNNIIQGKHMDSLAAATKRYVLAEILDVTQAVSAELESISGGTVLDTVPATVDGGLWFEVVDNAPVIKIFYGNNTYKLTPEIALLDPQLTLSDTAVTIMGSGHANVYIYYLGNGTLSVSDDFTARYHASLRYDDTAGYYVYIPELNTGTVTVSLSSDGTYTDATATIAVTYETGQPTPDDPIIS